MDSPFEFALQTRFCCEPLTSCQSSEFATCKLMFSGCHGWHPLNAAQDRSGIRYQALYVRIQRLIASLTKRQTRC